MVGFPGTSQAETIISSRFQITISNGRLCTSTRSRSFCRKARSSKDHLGTSDNSANKRGNPDPTEVIRWGSPTKKEMMDGWLEYITADDVSSAAAR